MVEYNGVNSKYFKERKKEENMKKKTFRKKILSTVLAWMLIVANVFPSMAVQAADVTESVMELSEVSGEAVSDNTVSDNTVSDNTVSDNTVSDNTVSDNTVSDNTVSDNTVSDNTVSDNTVSDNTEYEIYPTPHSMVYGEDGYEIEEVTLVYDSTIDQVTKDRMEEILETKEISFTVSDNTAEETTNILIGTYSAENKGYVQTELEKVETVTAEDFEGFTAHFVVSKDNNIYVLGEDTDAAFYGVTTLKHVFAQMEDNVIRNFTVKDYADVNIRGFIEGYYGVPWSNEDRMSLMKFGGEFKMTSYIFAPKDDPYHTSKWRELYPEEEFEAIKEMVAVGNANKCRFVWTAHPFMGGFNGNDVAGETQALLRKFDQLYDAGVRQFGVLGDDVGQLNRSVVIQLMTAVSDWAKEKGDVYDTVFCPAGYNHSWQGNYAELNDYDAGFPDDIQIFWTGEAVCQPIEVKTLDHFMKHNRGEGEEPRRAPLFWLNWPVNDVNHSRMLLGKGSLLHTDVDPATLAGAVTNPMQEAESSKNALFAVADYTWNIADFDVDTSWVDGFKYIEPDATEELFILANHMSDPSPNGHGLALEESANIKDMLEAYSNSRTGGEELKAEFEKIVAACDDFHTKSKNEAFKDELLPFTKSLKDLCNAAIQFINTQTAIDNGEEDAVWASYSQASACLSNSKTYDKPLKISGGIGREIVDPGSKRIIPFVEGLNTNLGPIVMSMIDDTKQFITFQTNRTDLTGDVLDAILDNNETTQVISKSPNTIATGDYIGISFTKAIETNSVVFKMGQSGNAADTFNSAKVQYTEDGKTWVDVEGSGYTDTRATVTVENLGKTIKGVRLIATADKGNTWLGIKDILINGKGLYEVEAGPEIATYTGTLSVPQGYSVYEGSVANVSDGSDDTVVWYSIPGDNCTAGSVFVLDLGEERLIGSVHFAMPAGDCLSDYTLQYSVDNSTWTDIGNYTGLVTDADINRTPVTARYLRVKNNQNTNKWLKIAEFTAKEPYVEPVPVYTNKNAEDVSNIVSEVGTDVATLVGTVELAKGEYVGIDLERIKDITSITVTATGEVTLQTSKNEVVWNTYNTEDDIKTYADARFVRLINNTDSTVSLNLTSLEVRSFEIYPISVLDTNFGSAGTHLLAFDQDRTTEAILEASQYVGKYITYDLGQVIDLESLKLVLHDGTTDYPRHAKVSVSSDNENWNEIMLIGNQDSNNEGEAENEDDISQLFPVHETSYYTRSVEGINQQVRYIKFEITRNKAGADKWVRIREIELNGGNMFLPEDNDPTIVSDAKESKGNTLSNMIDGELSTIFTPEENKAGFFTYNISDGNGLAQITILQNPTTISNAVVTAKVVQDGEVKVVTLGNLNGSLNKFDTSSYKAVNAITVTWEQGKVPGVYEIILKAGTATEETPDILVETVTPVIVAENLNKVYDGQVVDESLITVSGVTEGVATAFEYSVKEGENWKVLEEAPVNVGEYRVCAYVVATEDTAETRSNVLSFAITKKDIAMTDATLSSDTYEDISSTISVNDITFSGVVGVLERDTDYTVETALTVSGNNGTVKVTVTLGNTEKAANYNLTTNFVEKAIKVLVVQDIEIAGEIGKTYDGTFVNTEKLTVDKKEYTGEVAFKFYSENDTVNALAEAPKNAGNYYVRAYIPGTVEGAQIISNLYAFEIAKAGLTISDVIVDETGIKEEPIRVSIVSVSFNGLAETEKLEKDTDYTVRASYDTSVDKVIVTTNVTLVDNSLTQNYRLTETSYEKALTLHENIWIDGLGELTYNGAKQTFENLKVYDGAKELTVGKDYTVSYKNNVNAYTYKKDVDKEFDAKKAPQVTIKMKGNYKENIVVYFTITPLSIVDNSTVVIDKIYATYAENKDQQPKPVVRWNSKSLKAGKDYTFSVTEYPEGADGKCIVPGTYKVTVECIGNFTGTKDIDYVISQSTNQISMDKVKIGSIKAQKWSEEGIALKESDIKVTYKGKVLAAGEYEVEFDNTHKVGTATVLVTGTGNDENGDGITFIGSKKATFKITGISMSKVKVENMLSAYYYCGDAINPLERDGKNGESVRITTSQRKDEDGIPYELSWALEEYQGTDCVVELQKNVNKGTATIILTGNEECGFSGTKKVNFKIKASSVSLWEIGVEYDEYGIKKGGVKPSVCIDAYDNEVVEGVDYTISYKNNKKVGTASLTVKGKGNYTGTSAPITFQIVKKDLTEDNGITVVAKDKVANLNKLTAWKQSFKVYDSDGKALSVKKDYLKDAEYTLIQDAEGNEVEIPLEDTTEVLPGSIIQIRVTGAGNYVAEESEAADATVTGTYRILAPGHDISKAKITLNPKEFNGTEVEIDSNDDFKNCYIKDKTGTYQLYLEDVVDEEGNVIHEANIEVVEGSYVNNDKKGTAKVTLRGIAGSEFGGEKTVSFKITQRLASSWFDELSALFR